MRPKIRPASIDSHGKPGIAGSTMGVETELVDELIVVVGTVETVTVDTEVLTTTVVGELVVTGTIVVLLVALDSVVVAWDELEAVAVVEVTVWLLYVGGTTGSRWKMPARVLTPVAGSAPTAQPSVGFVVKTQNRPRPGPTVNGIGKLVHVAPFHHAVSAFPVLLL
jgi:hypothetical protein